MRISTIKDSVSTLAIEPVMKNSEIDCVCAMPKAETTVPNRLAAPPKVTTRKASTMYSEPEVHEQQHREEAQPREALHQADVHHVRQSHGRFLY